MSDDERRAGRSARRASSSASRKLVERRVPFSPPAKGRTPSWRRADPRPASPIDLHELRRRASSADALREVREAGHRVDLLHVPEAQRHLPEVRRGHPVARADVGLPTDGAVANVSVRSAGLICDGLRRSAALCWSRYFCTTPGRSTRTVPTLGCSGVGATIASALSAERAVRRAATSSSGTNSSARRRPRPGSGGGCPRRPASLPSASAPARRRRCGARASPLSADVASKTRCA